MDYVLSKNLPPELVDIICRDVHRRYMKDVCNEIQYNIVWILTKQYKRSFLIGSFKTNQYYALLHYDSMIKQSVMYF